MSETLSQEHYESLLKLYIDLGALKRTFNNIRSDLWNGKFFDAHEKALFYQNNIEVDILPKLKQTIEWMDKNGFFPRKNNSL